MNVAVDLVTLPDGALIAKAPSFPAWCYRPADRNADDATVKKGAEQSLKRHISRNMTFSWYGWTGSTT